MNQPWAPDPAPDDAEYFLSALDELRTLSGLRATAYQAIRAAGVLRILLTDPPLVHKIKKLTGLTPVYEIVRITQVRSIEEGRSLNVTGAWLDPELGRLLRLRQGSFPDNVRPMDLDGFLAQAVMSLDNEPASVLDLIHLYANKMGGAHREHSGHSAKSATLTAVLPDWEPVLRQSLLAACRVVLRALRPLEVELCLTERPGVLGLSATTAWTPPERT